MGAIYSLELVILILKFLDMHKDAPYGAGYSRALAVASAICALVAALMIGSVFGITESRVTYFGPFMPVYSLLLAVLGGISLFVLYSTLYHRVTGTEIPEEQAAGHRDLGQLLLYASGAVILFTLLKFAFESASTVPDFLIYHRFEHAFGVWRALHVEVVLGLFMPFILMLIPWVQSSAAGRLLVSALLLAGNLAMHMEILLAGQSRPVGPKAEQFPDFISYFPSAAEWLVFVFALSVTLILYTLGEKYLGLAGAYKPHIVPGVAGGLERGAHES
jgi:molybdopterin-containing oxidoreductase family membrane subunit